MSAQAPRLDLRAGPGFLGLNRNTVILLAAIILIAAGEETWMRFVPKYLEVLGASALVIGAYDGLKTLLGAVYAWPGGMIVDRFGHRTALTWFTLLSIAGYLFVLAVPHWAAVLGGAFLFLAWTTLSLPASFTLVAASLPAGKHTMGIGVQSLVRRIPVIAGPIAGGLLIDCFGVVEGVRYGLLASVVLGGLAVWLQQRIDIPFSNSPPGECGLRQALRQSDPRLRRLLWSDILIRFCERIPFAWVVIYAMDDLGASASAVGVLIGIEMVAAIACYVPTAWLADRYGKEPFIIATFIIFTAFPLALSFSTGFASLAVAFTIRGLKEFGEPARKALILTYAAPNARGTAVGAYYLIRDGVVSIGALAGAWLWNIAPQVNFWSAAALGACGTAFYVATLQRESSL
ncbi:MAG TPA: MFS transporter [Bryobacteraceae bacterium]|nr:MFS transporter [Bryobacteraceae bacterium]